MEETEYVQTNMDVFVTSIRRERENWNVTNTDANCRRRTSRRK